MNKILADIIQSNTVTQADGKKMALHSQLPDFEGALLQSWIKQYRPKQLLEIGLAYGVSSLYICDAIKDNETAYYHIIDAYQSDVWKGIGKVNLRRAGYLSRVTLHETLSELCLPRFLEQKLDFDFVFIDGHHTFDQVLLEFFYINRMLVVGGIIIFDDVHLASLQKILRYIDGYECYEQLSIPPKTANSNIARIRKMMSIAPARIAGFIKTAADTRESGWFKDF